MMMYPDDNTSKVGDLVRQVMEHYRLKDKLAEVRIRQLWHEIMPASITEKIDHIEFRNGILKMKTSSSPLRNELHAIRIQVIARLNERLDEELVQDLLIS